MHAFYYYYSTLLMTKTWTQYVRPILKLQKINACICVQCVCVWRIESVLGFSLTCTVVFIGKVRSVSCLSAYTSIVRIYIHSWRWREMVVVCMSEQLRYFTGSFTNFCCLLKWTQWTKAASVALCSIHSSYSLHLLSFSLSSIHLLTHNEHRHTIHTYTCMVYKNMYMCTHKSWNEGKKKDIRTMVERIRQCKSCLSVRFWGRDRMNRT